LAPRIEGLLNIVKEQNPEVICLQEVTRTIAKVILEQDWIRENYIITDNDEGHTFRVYGTMILSKLPYKQLSTQEFPSLMGRKLIFAQFIVNNERVCVATVHLESLENDAPVRAQQMEVANAVLDQKYCDHVALMGDFNVYSARERETLVNTTYVDIWKELYPNQNGFTYDPDNNVIVQEIKEKGMPVKPGRIDLILLRSKNSLWKPIEAKLLGTKSLDGKKLF